MAVRLRVKELAQKQGIKKAYQLRVKVGLSPSHAQNLWDGKTKAITLEMIDHLTDYFGCEPGDLFIKTKRK